MKNRKEKLNQAGETENSVKPAKKISARLIIKTAFITILSIVGSIAFIIVGMSAVCPRVVAKGFEYCGFDDAHYLVYKRIYARERTNENLYNIIQLSINRKDYEDMEKYIKLMIEGDNFGKFSKKIDEKTKERLGEEYSIYADSYESYLCGELTLALYNNHKTLEAKMRAIDSVYGDAREMYVYVNCIAQDASLTDLQKESEISTLQNRYGVSEKLLDKIVELNDDYNLAVSDKDKISVLEQRIRIAEIREIIATYTAEEGEVEKIQEEIKAWNEEIIALSTQYN